MSYIDSLEKAFNFIENHLCEEVDLSSIAKEAGYSLYHFHRIFKSVVGDSIKDYIRKRRITEAAKELVYTSTAIVEIGIKYGYESREAFSRAFEKVYGRTPSEVRSGKLLYFIREPMSFDYMMFKYKLRKEGLMPFYRKLPERYVVGEKTKLRSDGSNLKDIPLLWQRWNCERRFEEISERKYIDECMGICIFSKEEDFEYMIAYEVKNTERIPEGMEVYRLEPELYAVFKTIGPITESVQKTWDYIYSVWLNESEYRHACTHDIEYYYTYQGEITAELYVPIILKN
jgi:AraC family transcriptional regulator